MNFAAHVISFVFHPLLMVTYLYLLFAFYFPVGMEPLTANAHFDFVFIIFCVTFALPVVNVIIFRAVGSIRSYTMADRRERIFPFAFIALLYAGITYLLYSKTGMGLGDNLFRFLLIANALVIVAVVATLFYKVSVHSLAAWGMIGILAALNKITENSALFYPLLTTIVVAGLVMSARLQLQAHSAREVTAGAMLGLLTSFGGMIVLF